MADASHIEVLKPGLATSVQDKGRQGYYHLGIPPSGALDQYALAAANLWWAMPRTRRCWNARCWARNCCSTAPR